MTRHFFGFLGAGLFLVAVAGAGCSSSDIGAGSGGAGGSTATGSGGSTMIDPSGSGGSVVTSGTGGADTSGGSGGAVAPVDAGSSDDSGVVPKDGPVAGDVDTTKGAVRLVAYLPNYSGSFSMWATKVNFSRVTHLNLAFALATATNGWNMGASDADVKAIVDAAHAAGVKVLPSLGGGGGDQSVIGRYNTASNVDPLVQSLDAFIAKYNFDGADIDIESPANLGANFSNFVNKVVAKLRPEGKLVTAAVAQYLQENMQDATLHQFDFVNVMIYSGLTQTMKDITYYLNTKKVPKDQVVLGAGFFGTEPGDKEISYASIIKADPMAWSKDSTTVSGQTVNYTGMDTMKKLTEYAKTIGGIMVWDLTEDTYDDHSLMKVIQGDL
ncbi:MAG TPA: glycosyl hydrolase family 18 protein [Polyangia bacterium]|jgi:chitinase|nr:glycosyl hydrolase family 18 protein [Polyangia bacterium]